MNNNCTNKYKNYFLSLCFFCLWYFKNIVFLLSLFNWFRDYLILYASLFPMICGCERKCIVISDTTVLSIHHSNIFIVVVREKKMHSNICTPLYRYLYTIIQMYL